MSYSIQEFLNFLKLDEYLPNFINNNICDLRIVDETLLKGIGVDKIGHRKRILSELSTLFGVGNYSPQDEDGNINADDIPPPLPPKSKKIQISSGTVMAGKQKPVKPPRKPNSLQKTTPVPSSPPEPNQVTIPTSPQSPIHSTTPILPQSLIHSTAPILPQSPIHSTAPILPQSPIQSTAPISPQSPIQSTAPISPQSTILSTIPISPQLSDQQTIPTSPYSLTSPIQPTIQTSSQTTIPTLPQLPIQPPIQACQSPIETAPQPMVQHAIQKSAQPPIPPREDLQEKLVRKTTISKEERSTKTKSVELISFDENENVFSRRY